jgi:hypothetical protein
MLKTGNWRKRTDDPYKKYAKKSYYREIFTKETGKTLEECKEICG